MKKQKRKKSLIHHNSVTTVEVYIHLIFVTVEEAIFMIKSNSISINYYPINCMQGNVTL
jgi:hypothetical protein